MTYSDEVKSEPDFCRLCHLLQFLLFELLPENSLFVKTLPLLLLYDGLCASSLGIDMYDINFVVTAVGGIFG